jgi:hypothetical protein
VGSHAQTTHKVDDILTPPQRSLKIFSIQG